MQIMRQYIEKNWAKEKTRLLKPRKRSPVVSENIENAGRWLDLRVRRQTQSKRVHDEREHHAVFQRGVLQNKQRRDRIMYQQRWVIKKAEEAREAK